MSEQAPLLEDDNVVATSTGTMHECRTVHALLESSDKGDQEVADIFLRRLWALLVFQYGIILFIASPFALIDSFRHTIAPYHEVLEIVAFTGIALSLCLAITKGATYPYPYVALVSLTLFVALEMGLTFAHASWGPCGLVALGQASTSFAVILSVLQFDSRSLMWLSYPTAALMCLFLSGLWSVILAEVGLSWSIAAAVSLGGWAFALMVLFCCSVICKHVAPEEYILAVLFILCPEALLCLASKERHPSEEKDGIKSEKAKEEQNMYGAT
ncbi:hypothetical protein ACHAWF_013298 [Thalassiosira exigua]